MRTTHHPLCKFSIGLQLVQDLRLICSISSKYKEQMETVRVGLSVSVKAARKITEQKVCTESGDETVDWIQLKCTIEFEGTTEKVE